MKTLAKFSLATLVAATIAMSGAAPALAGGSYYKGVSPTPVNDGHRSEKYNPPGNKVNRPPPRNGAYYKGVFRK